MLDGHNCIQADDIQEFKNVGGDLVEVIMRNIQGKVNLDEGSEILVICCHQDSRVANMLSSLWLLNIIIITLLLSQDICWYPVAPSRIALSTACTGPRPTPAGSRLPTRPSSCPPRLLPTTTHLHNTSITSLLLLANTNLLLFEFSLFDEGFTQTYQIDHYILCVVDSRRRTCLLCMALPLDLFFFEEIFD